MITKACWAVLALIHLMPALALFKPSLLIDLYQVPAGSTSYVLLHHRAALFVGVFVACIWAMLQPGSRQIASVVVGISMASFLVLFAANGAPSNLRLIAIVDMIGMPFLVVAIWQAFIQGKSS